MEALPKTMRAVAIDHFGGPEVLSIHWPPVPEIDAHEVLIAMHTAGVGIWDVELREGKYASGDQRFPLVLGTDGSGTVVAVGSRVRRFKLGDAVYAYSFANPKGGFYAEFVAVPAENVGHIPTRLDIERAGAIPTTGLTALQGIDDALRLRKGESVIIHGASGGVGTLAVQFAKLRDARVFATASGKGGVALVRELGADLAVDGRHDDITSAARRFCPNGIDAALGLAGGEGLERCLDALRPGGRAAYPNGVEPEPSRRPDIEIASYDAIANSREFERLVLAAEEANLQVPIAAKYPLSDAAKAHERLAARHVLGKIVLRIG
jgi:NADPH:quinone reductase-like Zn-dependent oxidoreductase